LTGLGELVHTKHMKRTNLVLDEHKLEEATKALGVKTYSAAVNLALEEAIRMKKVERIKEFFGTGAWEGNLSDMREDPWKANPTYAGRR